MSQRQLTAQMGGTYITNDSKFASVIHEAARQMGGTYTCMHCHTQYTNMADCAACVVACAQRIHAQKKQ